MTIEIAQKFFIKFLFLLGRGPYTSECENQRDFYTDKPVRLIPLIFRFSLMSNKSHITCDIRSLYDYSQKVLTNPYITEDVAIDDQYRYLKHLKWLTKYNFFISHSPFKTHISTEQLTINVFSDLSQYQYVDYMSFKGLTLKRLKKLYKNLYITNIADEVLNICPNYKAISKYTNEMEDYLRRELLMSLKKLVTCLNPELGTLHFVLALKEVC